MLKIYCQLPSCVVVVDVFRGLRLTDNDPPSDLLDCIYIWAVAIDQWGNASAVEGATVDEAGKYYWIDVGHVGGKQSN